MVSKTLKDIVLRTKTNCFGVMMVYDAFAKRVTLTNKLIYNNLAYNMMLFFKTHFIIEHIRCHVISRMNQNTKRNIKTDVKVGSPDRMITKMITGTVRLITNDWKNQPP